MRVKIWKTSVFGAVNFRLWYSKYWVP